MHITLKTNCHYLAGSIFPVVTAVTRRKGAWVSRVNVLEMAGFYRSVMLI